MELEEIIKLAKESGSYFITATIKDKNKTEGDLTHYTFRNDFNNADIVHSLDECVRLTSSSLKTPEKVIIPEKCNNYKKPLRVCIITHLSRSPASYSIGRAVKNQIKILKEHGHDVTLYVKEGSKLDWDCKIVPIVPNFRMEKMVVNEEMKEKFKEILRKELPKYDVAISHDLFLQSTKTLSEGIRECGVNIPFLHFARSGVGHDMDFSMPNARFVYLNYYDAEKFAKAIKVPTSQVRTCPNEKEISFMFDFHPITKMIIDRFKLYNKDIIMTYPVCSSRFDAKNINQVIRVMAELKKKNKNVFLVVANSNGRKLGDVIKNKEEYARSVGLNDEDFVFTSTLHSEKYNTESEIPQKVCAELMQISNLMLMATCAEVCSNIELEASMTKQLLVINSDLPSLYNFADRKAVLSYPFSSDSHLNYSGKRDALISKLADDIIKEIDSNKADLQFRYVFRNHNHEAIYEKLIDIIMEAIKDFKK